MGELKKNDLGISYPDLFAPYKGGVWSFYELSKCENFQYTHDFQT